MARPCQRTQPARALVTWSSSTTLRYLDLAVAQLGPGGSQSILVGTVSEVEVALTGFGITASQTNGGGDVIHIESITVYGHLTNSFGPLGPPSIITTQGNGNGDQTTIDSIGNTILSPSLWGNIEVTQGNGNDDIVTVAAAEAGYTTTSAGLLDPDVRPAENHPRQRLR